MTDATTGTYLNATFILLLVSLHTLVTNLVTLVKILKCSFRRNIKGTGASLQGLLSIYFFPHQESRVRMYVHIREFYRTEWSCGVHLLAASWTIRAEANMEPVH